ncbi:MAG TPA: lytic transglycosylase domain-containing protein [Solirubrobacteraceae bacterium]|nr:lytic transglycosylase domain-containing protein [Solirubrobacteraceae bacterium]
MSTQRSAYRSRGRNTYRSGARTARRRGSLLRTLGAMAAIVVLVAVVVTRVQHDHSSGGLPLSDAAVIREQAAEKHLDPALIAGVIYAETKFEPRTSAAGALGLMQIEPETAQFIANRSGGVRFTTEDLATPKINLAYGSWYLRYLLDHYEGDEMLAVAAYNAGLANVDSWVAKARSEGGELTVSDIPFPETKSYVERVLRAQREYRAAYPHALGLT